MVNKNLLDYITSYRSQYSIEALKQSAIKTGYSSEEFDEAVNFLSSGANQTNLPPKTETPPVKKGHAWIIITAIIVLVVVVIAAIFGVSWVKNHQPSQQPATNASQPVNNTPQPVTNTSQPITGTSSPNNISVKILSFTWMNDTKWNNWTAVCESPDSNLSNYNTLTFQLNYNNNSYQFDCYPEDHGFFFNGGIGEATGPSPLTSGGPTNANIYGGSVVKVCCDVDSYITCDSMTAPARCDSTGNVIS